MFSAMYLHTDVLINSDMVSTPVRRKTSVYVDGELWERFKRYAAARGVEVSSLLEELMREELGDYLDEALGELAGSGGYELDFEPVEPRGPVSPVVREMRDERERGLLGQ
jgi:hypothetical protein